MKDFKEIYFCFSAIVTLAAILLLPLDSLANEGIGKAVAVNGPVKVYNIGNKVLKDLRINGDVFSGDIIITGSMAGVQIAVSYHTSVSVSPNSIVSLNRKISKKKKESYNIAIFRGKIRTTSYKKLLVKEGESKNVQKLNIQTPFGMFSLNGGDLVVDVSEVSARVNSENIIPIPCPLQVNVSAIGKLTGVLIDGVLPKKSSVVMEKCPEGSKNEEVVFVGFQKPKIKKRMISKSGTEFVNTWIIAGEVGYTPPLKKRPVLILKAGEEIAFDSEGKVVVSK